MFGSAHVTGAAGCTPENQIFRNPRLNQTDPKNKLYLTNSLRCACVFLGDLRKTTEEVTVSLLHITFV
jgi:hypothetical protein